VVRRWERFGRLAFFITSRSSLPLHGDFLHSCSCPAVPDQRLNDAKRIMLRNEKPSSFANRYADSWGPPQNHMEKSP
jgi:hypothetical protein